MLGTLDGGRLAIEELHRFPNTPVRVFDVAVLGHAAAVARDPARPGHRRTGAEAGAGWHRHRHLGRGFRSAGRGRRAGRQSRATIATRAPTASWRKLFDIVPRAGGFRPDRHPVHADQFALPALCAEAGRIARARRRAHAAVHAGPVELLATGVARAEVTIASTSQFYDPRRKTWAVDLFERLGLPTHILPEIVAPGTRLGPLLDSVAEPAGLGRRAGLRHRMPRYRVRRGRRPGEGSQLVLHQLRHVVADGRGVG